MRNIPVIVLTAKDLTAREHEVLNQRVNGLLMKGLTSPDQLLSKVNTLLGAVIVPASH
jgi:DNA-binding NarL/FixJ family response regulator